VTPCENNTATLSKNYTCETPEAIDKFISIFNLNIAYLNTYFDENEFD
jgi:hypothetical protein